MAEPKRAPQPEAEDRPGKSRTWWHPLLARLFAFVLGSACEVLDEVTVGHMPLRIDLVVKRRRRKPFSPEAQRDLPLLTKLFNWITMVEFKSPVDDLTASDLEHAFGNTFLYLSQQRKRLAWKRLSIVLLASTIGQAFRDDLARQGLTLEEVEPGVYRVSFPLLPVWIVELDRLPSEHEPVLTMFSHMFLQDPKPIIELLNRSGHGPLINYVVQQIQQFKSQGEEFAMQHRATQEMDHSMDELIDTVLKISTVEQLKKRLSPKDRVEGLPAKVRVEGLSAKDRVEGLPAKDRVEGLSAKELVEGFGAERLFDGLSPGQISKLAEMIEKRRSSPGKRR